MEAEFESQFTYARKLFHEVFNANSLHVKYPLLFLNQRAPGHGDPASEIHLRSGGSQSPSTQDAGMAGDQIEIVEGCTACEKNDAFLFAPRGVRQNGPNDGRNRNQAGVKMSNVKLNEYVTLGRSGLIVSPFCLGTMTFGNDVGIADERPAASSTTISKRAAIPRLRRG